MKKEECLFDGRKFNPTLKQLKEINEILNDTKWSIPEKGYVDSYKGGFDRQHWAVLAAIGLPIHEWLKQGYLVHHIDKNKLLCLPQNLMVVTYERHLVEHFLDEDWSRLHSQRTKDGMIRSGAGKKISLAWKNTSIEEKQRRSQLNSKISHEYWDNASNAKRCAHGVLTEEGMDMTEDKRRLINEKLSASLKEFWKNLKGYERQAFIENRYNTILKNKKMSEGVAL